MTLEDWSGSKGWSSLPKSIRSEFELGEEIENPELEKYDQVLMIWLRNRLQSVTNDFLCEKLNIEKIIGEPVKLESCPCCGYRTIGARGNYDICKVCWWEDDGQDNQHPERIIGGPNYGISLAMGRYNYLSYGLYDPKRTDLIRLKADENEFERGRIFEFADNKFLTEKGTDWKWKITLPNNV
ncbi:Cysteine-rich CPCC [Roseivirga pacifica]|uniref:Cysteine-rich CPCC n=1 Tax=Roseivirga pacifica TaxID=1267423 RepID=A0A1I0P4A6_9BACT|nr:CPCC family cysteine-rich protein [Roseivirga pacifica]RKQ51701.1 Cysteine-rich CPCC [Roseivirga pacifica]SEW09184.1 Cysteine-rich CPCC [Roseivirga pacifica]